MGAPALTRSRSRRAGGRNHFLPIVLVLGATGLLAAAGSTLEDGRSPNGGGAARGSARDGGPGRTLAMAWAARPGTLDPALANDATALNLVANLGDPLVKLGPGLRPVPNLAREWRVSAGGRRVTFLLRGDGRWTNGEPVTARDFAYAWRRVLSPAVRSPHAERLFGIRGAKAYHACAPRSCARLARLVGIEVRGDHELVVTLVGPRPWFPAEVTHPAFLPVHRVTVEREGRRWTRAGRIVTSGPFVLASLGRDSFTLVRNGRWRQAGHLALARVEGRVIADAAARVLAFDEGRVAALDGTALPAADLPALRERREYETYPALAASVYAFNLASIRDVHQRRAMALAVDRTALAETALQRTVAPAAAFLPESAVADSGELASPWLPPEGDLGRAREELERASRVVRRVTILHVDAPGRRAVATAVRDAWRDLGLDVSLRSQPLDAYLDFRGPLSSESVDVFELDVRPGIPDGFAVLAQWGCRSGQNKTNFCAAGFDALLRRAQTTPEPAARADLYGRAERVLSGWGGAMPAVPLYWDVYPNLEALPVRESFRIDPLGRIDLSAVELR
ncbi:MAG: peptide ABC transporter substrate-binding protein [Actinomycetota bacterium]|nr:peptide ABC transporter substrate-binding protein [Actinomycetota bacterium]